ncbi:hypothetical protein [Nocardioides nitrophenolicus]|uniref:hypothetical protein n=1 Tax=Nocardioides nitrophenolicus TaxID=60489 RepID=UPI0019593D82|nr:hypothetical protein [Nocardioides nitrophenolicus]MBM7519881.1 hypothetical protein [Nocardioides nitrophenolicus]
MRSRVLLSVLGVVGTLLAMGVLVLAMNLTLYLETSVPPRSALPDLPDGLSRSGDTENCGSGSCYREFTVVGAPGDSAADVLDRLPDDHCGRHSLVDWRRLCVGYRIQGDLVIGSVSLGKWLG